MIDSQNRELGLIVAHPFSRLSLSSSASATPSTTTVSLFYRMARVRLTHPSL